MATADELNEILKAVWFLFSKKTLTHPTSYSANYKEKGQVLFYFSFLTIDPLKYFAENSPLLFSKITVHKPVYRDLQYTFRSEKILFFSSFFNANPLKKKLENPLLSSFFQNHRSQASLPKKIWKSQLQSEL
jgi:hypothetical protein